MTDTPFPPPLQHPKTPEEQKADVAMLARAAILGADAWVINHRDELLGQVTAADRTRLEVEAVIGYLIGNNLITPTDDPPEWLALDIPDHLQPDIATAKGRYRRLQGGQHGC